MWDDESKAGNSPRHGDSERRVGVLWRGPLPPEGRDEHPRFNNGVSLGSATQTPIETGPSVPAASAENPGKIPLIACHKPGFRQRLGLWNHLLPHRGYQG